MAHVSAAPPFGHRSPARPALLAGLAVLVLAIGILAVTGLLSRMLSSLTGAGQTTSAYSTTTVSRGNLTVSVTGTGPIVANVNVPLSFKESGKLTAINVNVGDKVTKGQTLATLDTPDLQVALEQARANLTQAKANLAKIQVGPTDAAVEVAKTNVSNAQRAATDAQKAVTWTQTTNDKDTAAGELGVVSAQTSLDSAQSAVATAQDQQTKSIAADKLAIDSAQKNLDAIQANAAAQLPVLEQQVAQAKNSLWSAQISRDATCGHGRGTSCDAANATVAAADTAVNTANAQLRYSQSQTQQQIASAQASLESAQAQLAKDQVSLQAAVTTAQNQVKQDQITLRTAQASLDQSNAKSGQSLQSSQAQLDSSSNAVQAAQASLDQTTAPPLPADIDVAQAQVANAQAGVDLAQLNLDESTLVAPIDGTIAAINGSLQQWVTGGAPSITSTSGGSAASATAIMTLFDLNTLQVTVQVNEADIGKVAIGDNVTFVVNAFPSQHFTGKVLTIQPVGVTTSNVVSYNVTCSIQTVKGISLYPGMTATATIITAQRSNALLIPNTAVSFAETAAKQGLVVTPTPSATPAVGVSVTSTTGSTVIVLHGSTLAARAVTLGVVGNTHTEVLSGLSPDETIVVGQSGISTGGPNGGGSPGGRGGLFGIGV